MDEQTTTPITPQANPVPVQDPMAAAKKPMPLFLKIMIGCGVCAFLGIPLVLVLIVIVAINPIKRIEDAKERQEQLEQKTATSSSVQNSNWVTHSNTVAGYKISYPSTWTFSNSPAGTTFEHARDTFEGVEGKIEIDYGTGLGGGCGPTQEGQLAIKNSTLYVCVVNPDGEGGKTFNILGSLSGAKEVSWRGFISVTKPVETNEEGVLNVVKTLEVTD